MDYKFDVGELVVFKTYEELKAEYGATPNGDIRIHEYHALLKETPYNGNPIGDILVIMGRERHGREYYYEIALDAHRDKYIGNYLEPVLKSANSVEPVLCSANDLAELF